MEGETAHHLGRVLRAEPGTLYELSDGERVWLGRVEKIGRSRVDFALVEQLPAQAPSFSLTLLLAVVKFDRFEWALEKATELGVAAIVPLAAARSEKALLKATPKRAERWKKILLEASQQRADAPSLRRILPGMYSKRAVLAVGPEGGWTGAEVAAANKAGFQEVSLGKLILRTETAVAASLAALNYALGEE